MRYSDITPDYYNLLLWVDANLTNLHKHVHDEHCCNENEQILKEENYKQLMGLIDPNFLQQRIRAEALKDIKFDKFEDNIMIFKVLSSTGKGYYNCLIKFPQLNDVVNDLELSPQEAARLLLWSGDCKLWCNCPSLTYYYSWILTVLDSCIFPEDRPPNKNNPHHLGAVCKHLNRVLHVLGFYGGDLAKYIKELRRQRGLI